MTVPGFAAAAERHELLATVARAAEHGGRERVAVTDHAALLPSP